MEYTNLGNTGLTVSRICFGCMSIGKKQPYFEWVVDEEKGRKLIHLALELGINFFDTANAYAQGSSEEYLGKALAEFAMRDEVVIATKAYFTHRMGPNVRGLSRKSLMHAVDESLTRLQTDYIDLYQIHRWDPLTPIEETMEALHDIIKSGKVRYIGASSMNAWQFMKAQQVAERNGWTPFISMQNCVNLIYREEEREMLPLCYDRGVGVMVWSPLARGRLTRDWDMVTERTKVDPHADPAYEAASEDFRPILEQADKKVAGAVARIADKRGLPRAQIAMAWLLQKAEITAPIIGAAKEIHVTDAVAAIDVKLSREEVSQLEEHYIPHPAAISAEALMANMPYALSIDGEVTRF